MWTLAGGFCLLKVNLNTIGEKQELQEKCNKYI